MSYCYFADFYDLLTEDVNYENQAKYLYDLLCENGVNGGILLDLACGTATLSMLLAEKGYDMIAVDESEEMLSIAREKIDKSEIKNVMLLCQTMQELDLYGTIDACICTLDSLNHLESFDDFNTAIAKVSLFMNPNGIFIFDVNTVFKHRQVLSDNTYVIENDDVYCVWQNDYYEEEDTVEMVLDFFKKDGNNYRRTTQYITEKAYDIQNISSCLENNGFEVINIYDNMTKNEINDETQRAVFVARKVK